jgi:DNA-binding FrmR family transcriptional regulator
MKISKLHNRLRRLEGQLSKLQQNIEAEQDCTEVIPQFLAVKGAVAGAFAEYLNISLDACAETDREKVKRLISLLIKK